jgi:hypothetical protein
MKDNAKTVAITTSVPLRPTTNPINTKRPGAHRDRRTAAPLNHTANLPDPDIAVGGTAITTGTSLPRPPARRAD